MSTTHIDPASIAKSETKNIVLAGKNIFLYVSELWWVS